jgi:tRNA G18 (ribose-2'-O)-methylase SpoU
MDLNDLLPYFNIKENDLRKSGLFICEGKDVVDRMIISGIKVHSIVCIPDNSDFYKNKSAGNFPVYVLEKKDISKITGIAFHRGVIAVGYCPEIDKIENNYNKIIDSSLIVICPHIDNPENLGSIIRTARAFGIKYFFLGKFCADPYSRKAVRVSMGNVFFMNFYTIDDYTNTFDFLRKSGFTIIGADLSAKSVSIDSYNDNNKNAVIFGHEHKGIDEQTASLCDILINIPMKDDTDSLNVSVSAGIFLYKLAGNK